MKRAMLFLFCLLACSTTAFAQVDRATLTGVVKDPQNAVVPTATIKLTHVATGVETKTTVTADGAYIFVNLQPGEYVVEAMANGFQTMAQTIVLETGQRGRLDVALAVGGVGETVKVEGVTPLLDTQSAVVGSVVSRQEVANLPLAIRNWDDLLFTLPGVQGDRYTEQTGTTNAGRTGGVSVHGNRSLQNNFLLDGVDNNSISTNVQELSTQVSRPSIDAIDEFKVVTSPFTAEYGRAPGGAIVVTTKSGTNSIRGTAYDYYRDEAFDSKTYFAKKAVPPLAKPPNDQNQFGLNLGGPIVRNKAFFFGDFEGTRISQGVLRTGRVPTEAERNGVFSSTILDPANGRVAFANNTIPADRIDPLAKAILALVPLPNTTGSNNFIRQPTVEDNGERYLGRADLKIGTNDNLFVRYIFADRTRFVPGFFGGVVDGTSTSAWGRNFLKSHSTMFGWTKVFSPTLVNEARVSWARGISDGQQDPFGQAGPKVPGVPDNPVVAGGIIGIDISGNLRLGSPNFMPKYQHTDQVQYLNTLTWLRGAHNVKLGADIMTPMNNQFVDIPSTRGNVGFNGQFTGNAVADFLIGYARQAELSNVHIVNQRRYSYAFFVQDDWRPTSKLTLNIGLRYDFMTPAYEKDNHMANFDPATASLVFAKDGSLQERALLKPDRNNVGPRFGAVYQLTDRTVVRGGFGIFYNFLDRIGSEDQLALNPPGLRNNNQTTTSNTTPVIVLSTGFPANYIDPSNIVLSRLLIRAANPSGENAMFKQFSIGGERQLARDFVVSADLVGNYGSDIAVLRNLNQPANGNGARPYPNFGHIQWRDPIGTSEYLGLDVSVEKRMSRAHSFRVSYTISDARDQAPEHLAATSGRPQNTNDIAAWEGPSDFDVRHRFVANFIVETPIGSGRRFDLGEVGNAILRDWTISGIYTARTGRPFTVTQGSLEGAAWVPNVVGDPEGKKTVESWFNVAAFARVSAGVFGDAGRNSVRGPGYSAFDMSVQRRVPIRGHVAASLRWDVFNLFDRANFGNPNPDITSSTAGVISSLAGDPRVMQFSIRLHF
jgi:carboxypeptidase family protein/TonB-dependent receptor-like protein